MKIPTPKEYYEKKLYMNSKEQTKYAKEVIHDPQQWSNTFNAASTSRKQGSISAGNELLALRLTIQEGIFYACRNCKYTLASGEVVTLDEKSLLQASYNTKQCKSYGYTTKTAEIIKAQSLPTATTTTTQVEVYEGDCIDLGLMFNDTKQYSQVAVLNMASATSPGGGYRIGQGAQEENLHRRTNLFQCLEDVDNVDKKRKWGYPIPDDGGLFTPNATVIRGNEFRGYPFLATPSKLSFVAVAAIAHPRVTTVGNELKLDSDAEARTECKIRAIFNICLENNVDCIVLSALGAGAYKNPPKHIAEIFKRVLEKEFQGRFKKVAFAIFDDHNSKRLHNPEGNVKPFADVFGVTLQKLNYTGY